MTSLRQDPYLWVHLAGVAAVPLWLSLCWLGLAAGNPLLPAPVEIAILAALGALPVLWMQWFRPFCIFSLVLLALKPAALCEHQRQLLSGFRGPVARGVALLVPIPLAWAAWQLLRLAPVAAQVTPFSNHVTGFSAAVLAFFLANLFAQVPASVAKVLLLPSRRLQQLPAYPVEAVAKDFTLIGLRVSRILPDIQTVPEAIAIATPQETPDLETKSPEAAAASVPAEAATDTAEAPGEVETDDSSLPSAEDEELPDRLVEADGSIDVAAPSVDMALENDD